MNLQSPGAADWLAICVGESAELAGTVWNYIDVRHPKIVRSRNLQALAAAPRSCFTDVAAATYELSFDDLLALPCGAADLRASSIILLAPRGFRSKHPRLAQLWARAAQSVLQCGAVVAACYRSDQPGHEEWLDIGMLAFDLCDPQQCAELERTLRAGKVLVDTRPELPTLPPTSQQLRFVFDRVIRRQPVSAALFRLVAGGHSLEEAAAELALDRTSAESRIQYAFRSLERACNELGLSDNRIRQFPSDVLGQGFQRAAISSAETELSKRNACKTHLARESAERRAATLIVGSGLYQQLGFPAALGSWSELLIAFTSRGLDGEQSSVRESFRAAAEWSPAHAWDLAVTIYAKREGIPRYMADRALRSLLHKWVSDTEAVAVDGHGITGGIPARIVEANLAAVISLHVGVRAFSGEFDLATDSHQERFTVVRVAKRRTALKLFHVHGDHERAASMSLGTRDFGRLQQEWELGRARFCSTRAESPPIQAHTPIAHVLTSPLVFVGCGLTAVESTVWRLLAMRMHANHDVVSEDTPLGYFITAERLTSDVIARLNAMRCQVLETQTHHESWDLLFDCLGPFASLEADHAVGDCGLATGRSAVSRTEFLPVDCVDSLRDSENSPAEMQAAQLAPSDQPRGMPRAVANSARGAPTSSVLVSIGLPWPTRRATDRRFALGEPWPTLHGLVTQTARSIAHRGTVEIRALRASGGDIATASIVRRIARSDVLIFDVTPCRRGKGPARINQNVLFEIGVARGLGKEVLLVSKSSKAHSLLPSDLAGYFVLNLSSNADRMSLAGSVRALIRKSLRLKSLG